LNRTAQHSARFNAANEVSMPVDVEIDLYSGRPNPGFGLTDEAANEFQRRLNGLPPLASDGGTVRDAIGYRGVRVAGHGSGFAHVVVSGGVVEIHDAAGQVTRRADPNRALERWLVEAGSGHVPPDDLAIARDDLTH
jgi:hypothetical protein